MDGDEERDGNDPPAPAREPKPAEQADQENLDQAERVLEQRDGDERREMEEKRHRIHRRHEEGFLFMQLPVSMHDEPVRGEQQVVAVLFVNPVGQLRHEGEAQDQSDEQRRQRPSKRLPPDGAAVLRDDRWRGMELGQGRKIVCRAGESQGRLNFFGRLGREASHEPWARRTMP